MCACYTINADNFILHQLTVSTIEKIHMSDKTVHCDSNQLLVLVLVHLFGLKYVSIVLCKYYN